MLFCPAKSKGLIERHQNLFIKIFPGFYVHFLYLHKENEPKESAADHLVTQA
jgi:hypothetical protein